MAGTYEMERKKLGILLPVSWVSPKKRILDTFLTSTKLHLVDQISSEGRT